MGVYLGIENYDQIFKDIRGKAPIIINDVDSFTEKNNRDLERLLFTTYTGDALTNIPSCECGAVRGAYNVDEKGIGVLCRECNHRVQSVLDQDLQPMSWIRAPHGVRRLTNPLIWGMLTKRFTKHGFSIIEWLCDTRMQPDKVINPAVRMILENINQAGIKRGYNNFVDNFDFIMATLFNMRGLKYPKTQIDSLRIFLAENRAVVFPMYLPVPHRSLLVVEETEMDTYTDQISTQAIDAVRALAGVDTELQLETDPISIRKRENRTARVLSALNQYYDCIYKEKFGSKEGLFRKHVYAGRANFSFRCVISSITDPHQAKEIHIPWGVGMAVFRLHLANKLLRMNMTPRRIAKFLDEHASIYHPLLDQLFQEIIADTPTGFGVACTLNRNPSLGKGSIQRTYITKVKTDPQIWTVSMSILIVSPLNADFDGDALNFTLALDQKVENWLENLAPYKNAFTLDKPGQLAEAVAISKPALENIAAWFEDRGDPDDPVKRARMQSIALH